MQQKMEELTSTVSDLKKIAQMTENPHLEKLKTLQALNRDQLIGSLPQNIPIHSLLDADYCIAVSKKLDEAGDGWQVLRATASAGSMLPETSGLYMFFWEPFLSFKIGDDARKMRWCLYVGKADATTLRSRYEGEYAKLIGKNPELLYQTPGKLKRKDLLSRYLCLYPLEIWYLQVKDSDMIPDLEGKLIDLLNPPLNTQKSLRATLLKPQSAF